MSGPTISAQRPMTQPLPRRRLFPAPGRAGAGRAGRRAARGRARRGPSPTAHWRLPDGPPALARLHAGPEPLLGPRAGPGPARGRRRQRQRSRVSSSLGADRFRCVRPRPSPGSVPGSGGPRHSSLVLTQQVHLTEPRRRTSFRSRGARRARRRPHRGGDEHLLAVGDERRQPLTATGVELGEDVVEHRAPGRPRGRGGAGGMPRAWRPSAKLHDSPWLA